MKILLGKNVIKRINNMPKEKKELTLTQKLNKIQQELKVGKSQFNKFANFSYRSCEDILMAVKPLLRDCSLVIDDKIVKLGDRYYVKATATLLDSSLLKEEIFATAYAREAQEKKGMDASQITGSTSSYARKYALNGLFCIDDAKDADTRDNKMPTIQAEAPFPTSTAPRPTKNVFDAKCEDCGKDLTTPEIEYSVKFYGLKLCRSCQENHQKLTNK